MKKLNEHKATIRNQGANSCVGDHCFPCPNLYKPQFGNTQIVVRESSIYKKKIHKITESLEIKKLGQLSVG